MAEKKYLNYGLKDKSPRERTVMLIVSVVAAIVSLDTFAILTIENFAQPQNVWEGILGWTALLITCAFGAILCLYALWGLVALFAFVSTTAELLIKSNSLRGWKESYREMMRD